MYTRSLAVTLIGCCTFINYLTCCYCNTVITVFCAHHAHYIVLVLTYTGL